MAAEVSALLKGFVMSMEESPVVRIPLVERHPVILRVPVKRNHVISVMTQSYICTNPGCRCAEARPHFQQAFYDSIYKLVFKIANKYIVTCPHHTVPDLAQMCLDRILAKLDLFEPDKSQFSTWAWTVCKNLLNRTYDDDTRETSVFVPIEPAHENIGRWDHTSILHNEMVEAIRLLRQQNPEWHDVITAMFGDDTEQDFSLPDGFCIAKIARATGRGYNDVYGFVHSNVRQLFIERFTGV